MRKLILLLLLAVVSGCSTIKPLDTTVEFQQYYTALQESQDIEPGGKMSEQLFTLSCQDISLKMFLRWISTESGVSVVCEDDLDQKPVSVEVQDQSVSDILGVVARRLGVQVTKTGNLYFLGTLRPEDRGVLVRVVKRMRSEELKQAVSSLLSQHGRAVAYDDGLVVIGDTVEVLRRVNEMLDAIDSAPSNSWVVQMYIIDMRDELSETLGIDTTIDGELAVNLAESTRSSNSYIAANGMLNTILKAERQKSNVALIAKPMFVLMDGSSSRFTSGESVPVPKKVVSDNGTVSTSGFEYIQTGLTFTCGVRESTIDTCRLSINVGMSSVVGFVENSAPITNRQDFNTTAYVKTGGVYLLGSVKKDSQSSQKSGFFSLIHSQDKLHGTIQIWAKCYKIKK